MEVGIIGGGIMGLAAAFFLSRAGIPVTVFEKEDEAGGLSGFEEIVPGLRWDRYYHVILPTDDDLLQFLDDLGLSNEVDFVETKTGFYSEGELHSMSDTIEFLRFKPISLLNKLRLGLGILYASMLKNSPRLENTTAQTWLTNVFGRVNYEKMWEPLLRSKLGGESSLVSASFIWAYIHRLYGTRKKGSKKEMMGCVRGGYQTIVTRLKERLESSNGRVLLSHNVQEVKELSNGKIGIRCDHGRAFEYDIVLSTVPSPHVVRFWSDIPPAYKVRLESIRYLKLVCATLLLNKPLSSYYVMNITDSGFPFTGLIEASHVIPRSLLGGRGLTYLPRYMSPDDPFYEKPDDEVREAFLKGIERIFPHFSRGDVLRHIVHRDVYVQPVQELNYSAKILPMETPAKNFYFVNTTMINDSSLNNNQVVRLARGAARSILELIG